MTNRATIATLNAKIDTLKSELTNAVAGQMSTMRNRIGSMLGMSHDGKRDLYDIYGYPKTLAGTDGFESMYRYSRREGIANRLTWGVAKTCWRDGFDVYASSEDDAEKILEDELNKLFKAGLNKKIEAADILNRIGRMAVLFVGVPDNQEPDQPLGRVVGNPDNFIENLYFIPYGYDGVTITQQVSDVTDPRFGLPEFYTLQKLNLSDNEKDNNTKSIRAHWSRVIHLNENALDSDIEGMGALEPIFNRILDLDKTLGGSAEAYFRNAKGKIAYEIEKDFAAGLLTDPAAKAAFQDGAEKFTNEMQDHTVAAGSKVKTLPTPHASPLDTAKVSLWAIAGYSGYPLRILTGEGAGQLAGSEDQLAVNQITRDRQRTVCAPWVCRLFEILQQAGMLKALPEDYEIRFPVQEAATEKQKADNGDKKAATILKIVQAKSQLGGEGIDLKSAFTACGAEDVTVEEPEIDDLESPDDDEIIDDE